MTRAERAEPWVTARIPNRLQSDIEESVAGTEWHQEAIGALAAMPRIAADRRGETWGVCEQFVVLGLRKEAGEEYSPRPDVMVLPHVIDKSRSSVHVSQIQTPLFIAEVASASTVAQDVTDKPYVYAQLGVPEYVVFDPDGSFLKGPIRAWRLSPLTTAAYVPWLPDTLERLHSTALDVPIEVAQPLLGLRTAMAGHVYGHDGGDNGEPELLASAYRNTLRIAEENGVRSIAFPAISAGIYGDPMEQAARIALETTVAHLRPGSDLHEVIFVLFTPDDLEVYRRTLSEVMAS